MAEEKATVLILSRAETSAIVPIVVEAGHRVIEADSSSHALGIAMRSQLDVVILPVDTEPINGEGLLHLIRRLTPAVIIVVGEASETEMANAIFHGADAYFPFPVNANMLRIRLLTLLRAPRTLGQGRRPGQGADNEGTDHAPAG